MQTLFARGWGRYNHEHMKTFKITHAYAIRFEWLQMNAKISSSNPVIQNEPYLSFKNLGNFVWKYRSENVRITEIVIYYVWWCMYVCVMARQFIPNVGMLKVF